MDSFLCHFHPAVKPTILVGLVCFAGNHILGVKSAFGWLFMSSISLLMFSGSLRRHSFLLLLLISFKFVHTCLLKYFYDGCFTILVKLHHMCQACQC